MLHPGDMALCMGRGALLPIVTAFALAGLLACERDPGNALNQGTQGSSSQPLTAMPTGSGPPCAESVMRCTRSFVYVDRGEASVEVRGDFRAGAWTAGVPMTKRGKTWMAEVGVPYGRDVQYKLFLDGSRWVVDPANPASVAGNSLLEAVTCNPHRCEGP